MRQTSRSAVARDPGLVEPTLRYLTLSANHGKLWFAAAGVLACSGKRYRRAGLRGIGSLAGASLLSNVVLKPMFDRRRPAVDPLLPQALTRMPWTSSFPSGHSASAAAFAVGAALERPRTLIVLAPLAAAVAYSRVYLGVHYRSDVLAGVAVGAGVAMAGHHLWPAAPVGAARTAPGVAPALPGGDGLTAVINARSGSAAGAGTEILSVLPHAHMVHWNPETPLNELVPSDTKALAVAGGDGTVATVAQLAVDRGLPMAVFASGTLNHFAGALDLETYSDTARAVTRGTAGNIDVGRINGTAFLNTVGLGGYPDMVRLRERLEHKIGKWPAAAYSLYRALRGTKPIVLEINGEVHPVWAVFVGNGTYRPRGLNSATRSDLADGVLDLQYLRADHRFGRTIGVVASLFGTVDRTSVLGTIQSDRIEIRSLSGPVRVAHDGEVEDPVEKIVIKLDVRSLTVYR